MDWLWQAFVVNGLWEWVLVPLGGVVLAYLRKKNPSWAGIVIYGLGGSAFIAMVLFALIGRPMLSKQRPQTTSENVEANVKAWADDFSLGVQKQTNDRFYFVVGISLPSGRTALVGRPKGRERYLQIEGDMALGPEHIAALPKLTPSQLERLMDEINIEMARSKIGFTLVSAPIRGIVVSKAIPITSSLTEDSFMNSLDEIDSDMLLAREAIRLAFARITPPQTPSQ